MGSGRVETTSAIGMKHKKFGNDETVSKRK